MFPVIFFSVAQYFDYRFFPVIISLHFSLNGKTIGGKQASNNLGRGAGQMFKPYPSFIGNRDLSDRKT